MSPQATEEVSYRIAVRSDGCEIGTNGTPKSFPSRGRCRRRRRKRCRTESHSVPSEAQAERRSPLPSSGLRETPDATLPSRGGILRAVRSDGRKNGTSSAPKSFPSRGRCRRRRRKMCRIGSQFLSTNAKSERMTPLPSSGLRETPDATLPSRGGSFCASIRSHLLTSRAVVCPHSALSVARLDGRQRSGRPTQEAGLNRYPQSGFRLENVKKILDKSGACAYNDACNGISAFSSVGRATDS